MDRALKQRLLGAVILTALLVIVVPEWLDGAGHRARYPGHIDVPETPRFVPMKEIMEPVATPAEPATEKAPEKTPEKTVTQAEPKVDSKPSPQAKTPAKVALASAKSDIDAWALQVGSFSEEKNARVMRDQMRDKGYAAYIDHLGKKNGDQYRVRIGPELDRKRIDALRDKVEKKEKIKGLVVKHP